LGGRVSFRRFTLGAAWRHRKAAIPIALASFALPPRRLPERPIFVIGCPRSGTTLLFRLLRKLPDVVSIGTEGHALWETFHHPRDRNWRSSALDADDVGGLERRYVAWAIALLAGRGRFVDKTPRNVLRLPYLDAMFPDATFVFLYRDGRSIVSSLYERWIWRGAHSHQRVPRGFAVSGLPERTWAFVLPEGWEAMNGRPLEEVCAFQYLRSLEAMLECRPALAPERLVEVRYEDLCRSPEPVLGDLLDRLDLAGSDEFLGLARQEIRPLPEEPKWRRERGREIAAVLPIIRPMLERTGYAAEVP
jgi:hypothetical protein